MKDEVARNRGGKQAEGKDASDLALKGAALRGPAADLNSKGKVPEVLMYHEGVKLRTFKAANPVAAQPTAVPQHSQAGALLRKIASPTGSAQPQQQAGAQAARARSVAQARPGAYSNIRQRPMKLEDPFTNRIIHEQTGKPNHFKEHKKLKLPNSYKTQQQLASERLQAAALQDKPATAGVRTGLLQLFEREGAQPHSYVATAPNPATKSSGPVGNTRDHMWSKLFTITSQVKRRRAPKEV